MSDKYKIVRMFYDRSKRPRVIYRGLTLEEAQAHCKSEEASSSTATSATAEARTRKCGAWFDGYERE